MRVLVIVATLLIPSAVFAQQQPAPFAPFVVDEAGYQQIIQKLSELPIRDLNAAQQIGAILGTMETKAVQEQKAKTAAPPKPEVKTKPEAKEKPKGK